MKPTTVHRRGRALASLTAAMGLALTGAATVATGPATSAEPAGDCAQPYPVADLQDGAPVTAESVTQGTTPRAFEGKVLGVLDGGIAPGLDMIMVDFTPADGDAAAAKIGGIWQGMSGSPVYTADGRLLGAVAYGLSWGPSWIAGVTPYEEMDGHMGAAAAPRTTIKVGDAQARTIARSSDVTQAQAQEGFSQLPMPTGVSGISRQRLKTIKPGKHQWLSKNTYAMGSSAAPGDGPGADTIEAGGNLAASLSYGDVTQAGVGTATSVCNGKVVGFGHPMAFLGNTSMALHPASAIYVQPESLGAPFKVANLGAPVGTITDDHLTGITGSFGDLPQASDVTSSVTYGDSSRTGTSHVTVPQALASTVFYESLANHDRVVDGQLPGSELMSWRITGHDGGGAPFDIAVTDRYASGYDISYDSTWELADFAYSLSSIPGVVIDDVTIDSAVSDDDSVWQVSRLEQRVHGSWTKVGRGAPVLAKAGAAPQLRAVLKSATDTRTVPLSVKIPAGAAGSMGRMYVTGGSYIWSEDAYPSTLPDAQSYAKNLVRNDQVQVSLDLFAKRKGIHETATTSPQDKVVTGVKHVKVLVR